MQKVTMKNYEIIKENNEEFYKKWFSGRKEKSFLAHVDTLYYMINVEMNDWNTDERKMAFINDLKDLKEKARLKNEPVPAFTDVVDDITVEPYMAAQMYSYHFGKRDNFDVFVCETALNEKTPPIMVQIRSETLWLLGMKKSFDKSYIIVEKILNKYGIKIESTQENRIDYAYHTNYINNEMTFFPEKSLREMQVSNFTRGSKDFVFYKEGIESDYLTLGRRKSNNVFFRVYNKTKEVIEKGYKQFFIQIWLKNGLINNFDELILRKAFINGTYESKDKLRCEFYYDYGKNNEIRREIGEKLANSDTPLSWYKKRAKNLVPDITIITNVEIETKRKYYERLVKSIITSETSPRKNIYNLFEQMKPIMDKLTSDTIRFVLYKGKYAKIERTERPYADWWKRLRSANLFEINDFWVVDYIRQYQLALDVERQKNTAISKFATTAAYMNSDFDITTTHIEQTKFNIIKDFQVFFENLNDNDLNKYYKKREKRMKEIKDRLDK